MGVLFEISLLGDTLKSAEKGGFFARKPIISAREFPLQGTMQNHSAGAQTTGPRSVQ